MTKLPHFSVSAFNLFISITTIVNSKPQHGPQVNVPVLSLSMPLHASSTSSSEEISNNFSPEFFNPPPSNYSHRIGQGLSLRNTSSRSNSNFIPVQLQFQNYQTPIKNASSQNTCPTQSSQYKPTFDAVDVFPRLGFHDSWIRKKWFWGAQDFNFEQRYKSKFERVYDDGFTSIPPPPLRVFIVPHSHNDPGWLKTYEGYFTSQTRHTLDLAVEKLTLYHNMTFVWNEICFLSLWWERAKTSQKLQFLNLVQEGRLEILTGAWVMADEATNTIGTLIDEIIQGRQWTSNFLGVTPNVSWAIDPFGHSSTMPYLFNRAGIDNMVIQRLHYAWKKYLGEKQYGNFNWIQRWDSEGDFGIRCHNSPYDIYTTKHSCGPNPLVCLKLDFRSILGEYSEYSRHSRPVRDLDLDVLATEFVGQLQRTASLYPDSSPSSKVVMFELGEDFRFDKAQEWDQQYENYVPLMNHINKNYPRFRMDIRFGTVSDYFKAIENEGIRSGSTFSSLQVPTFVGDFFPYADAYISARPGYWTGFYGTRPYWKKFYRETESHMRSAEILYTYANNLVRDDPIMSVILRQEYQNLVQARKNVALFAHHDGITGTSRKTVMEDYGLKLMTSTRSALQIQRQSIRAILHGGLNITISALGLDAQILTFGELATKIPRVIYESDKITKKILIFNSLSFTKTHLIRVLVTSPYVKVVGKDDENILSQINPIADLVDGEIVFSPGFELSFLAELSPLTLHSYEVRKVPLDDPNLATTSTVSCRGCKVSSGGNFEYFEVENVTTPTLILGNGETELYFNSSSGLLRRVTKLQEEISIPVKVQFGGYKSIFRDSGAYLLKLDLESHVQIPFNDSSPPILMVEGPVTSYLTSFNPPITTTTRLLGVRGEGIRIQNVVDLGTIPAEVYMRVDTWLNSTTGRRNPTMFTDQNGYTIEKRVTVPWIEYEGNVYPVNTMAYIQDRNNLVRFSVLVDRAHGFNSMYPGRLETLIERRTMFDDGRGMSQGVDDNKKTASNYIFNLERLDRKSSSSPTNPVNPEDPSDYGNNLVTLSTQKLSLGLNHNPPTFGYDDTLGRTGFLGKYSLLNKSPPQDSHIITMRTLSNVSMPLEEELPSERTLLVTQKLGVLSLENDNNQSFCRNSSDLFQPGTKFVGLDIDSADVTDLAGVLGVHYSGKRSSLPIVERKGFEITSLLVKFQTKGVSGSSRNQYHHNYYRGHNNNHNHNSQHYATSSRPLETSTMEGVSYEKA